MMKMDLNNRENPGNDKAMKLFSHAFFISLILVFIFIITGIINHYTMNAYREESIFAESPGRTGETENNISRDESKVDPFMPEIGEVKNSSDDKTNIEVAEKKIDIKKEDGNSKGKNIPLTGKDLGLSVTGIIINKEGNRAILTGENGKSYMIQKGQKIGEWTVSSIDEERIILKSKDYTAHLEPSPGYRSLKMPRQEEFNGVVGINEEDPGFRVAGIMKNEEGFNAVLTGLDGKNYMVKPGQVIGKWTVSFISDKMVFLRNNKTMTIAVLELNSGNEVPNDIRFPEQYSDTVAL